MGDFIKRALQVMDETRGIQDNPKVGLFWYSPVNKECFGVVAVDKDGLQPSQGLITCKELHQAVWKKEFNRNKYHKSSGINYFKGDYSLKPRGRVFFDLEDSQYVICTGKWIDEYPDAKEIIVKEFNLEGANYRFEQVRHWDIGQTWK